MTNGWFAMFALGMLGGSAMSKALAPTIVYGLCLVAMYPSLDYALELAALYGVCLVVAGLRS